MSGRYVRVCVTGECAAMCDVFRVDASFRMGRQSWLAGLAGKGGERNRAGPDGSRKCMKVTWDKRYEWAFRQVRAYIRQSRP